MGGRTWQDHPFINFLQKFCFLNRVPHWTARIIYIMTKNNSDEAFRWSALTGAWHTETGLPPAPTRANLWSGLCSRIGANCPTRRKPPVHGTDTLKRLFPPVLRTRGGTLRKRCLWTQQLQCKCWSQVVSNFFKVISWHIKGWLEHCGGIAWQVVCHSVTSWPRMGGPGICHSEPSLAFVGA